MTALASTPTRTSRSLRACLLVMHRWVGLFIAVFLVVAGLTGTLLVFYKELDAALNPHLFKVNAEGAVMNSFALREKVEAQLDGKPFNEVKLNHKPGEAWIAWTNDREYFINPYTGAILGSREWGNLGEGFALNLMPFIYRLHYSLGLGDVGVWLFGIVALLWTVDCFVGAYLTFPPSQGNRSKVKRWASAWLVKTGQLFSTLFTFHRAAGLWLWAMLFVFAWSGVGFNLKPVFKPVMGLIGYEDAYEKLPIREQPLTQPALDFHQAYQIGQTLMSEEAKARGFQIEQEGALVFDPGHGVYRYSVHSSFDLGDRWPETSLWFDANNGQRIALDLSTGDNLGTTVAHWFFALHLGIVGGMPYRIFVGIMGLAIPFLALTGVYIWWRKRRPISA
jgi:uncharacterized iron-regulated membrane protein